MNWVCRKMIKFRIVNFILSKILAFKRRFFIFFFGDFDPYPKHKYISYSPSDYYLKKASFSTLKLNFSISALPPSVETGSKEVGRTVIIFFESFDRTVAKAFPA